jgi:hypothetical protein
MPAKPAEQRERPLPGVCDVGVAVERGEDTVGAPEIDGELFKVLGAERGTPSGGIAGENTGGANTGGATGRAAQQVPQFGK